MELTTHPLLFHMAIAGGAMYFVKEILLPMIEAIYQLIQELKHE